MSKCGFCGRDVVGEGVLPIEEGPVIMGSSDGGEYEVGSSQSVSFCCEGCAWAYGLESHTCFYGMTGKEARQHLIAEHGLSPGKPAAKMSRQCFEMFSEKAEMFSNFRAGGVRAVKFKDN